MKVVFTGGGTGGHFYPLIAVAQELNDLIENEKVAEAKLFYFSDKPYDEEALLQNRLTFRQISAGKMRTYFSLQNIGDMFKTAIGILQAIWALFTVYPDVVFAKGGYASFPTLCAARILRIPVVIHESDSAPGRVGKWSAKFAKRIALSYKEAADYFPYEHVAHTGQPIRREILRPTKAGAYEYLKLDPEVPTIVIFGGSSGAKILNDTLISALPYLVDRYQIVHMAGRKLFDEVKKTTDLVLKDSKFAHHYKIFDFLNPLATSMAAGASQLVISRAGSHLFAFAAWGLPTIVIPRTNSVNDHNRKNAFHFARAGAGVVIEESNLTPRLLTAEIDRILSDPNVYQKLSQNAKAFFKPGAAELIAREIFKLALSHEQ